MKRILGTVTIGQAPRVDIIPDILPILGENLNVVESGALDGLTKEDIAKMAPQKGDYVLVTRMKDGTSVTVAERYITPRVEEKIRDHFQHNIPVVLLLCTGEFPSFGEERLLIRPQRILYNVVQAVAENRKLGVITPSEDQIAQSKKRWETVSGRVSVVAASPYADSLQLDNAIEKLQEYNPDIAIMDCMGYTIKMQQKVRDSLGKPVFLARSVVARVIKDMFG
jgi:protein AroM